MKLLLLIVILFITANIFTAVTLNFKKEIWTVIHSLFNKL